MRYFITLAYDGTAYHGWQIQPNAPSVEETIERALSTVLRRDVDIAGALSAAWETGHNTTGTRTDRDNQYPSVSSKIRHFAEGYGGNLLILRRKNASETVRFSLFALLFSNPSIEYSYI